MSWQARVGSVSGIHSSGGRKSLLSCIAASVYSACAASRGGAPCPLGLCIAGSCDDSPMIDASHCKGWPPADGLSAVLSAQAASTACQARQQRSPRGFQPGAVGGRGLRSQPCQARTQLHEGGQGVGQGCQCKGLRPVQRACQASCRSSCRGAFQHAWAGLGQYIDLDLTKGTVPSASTLVLIPDGDCSKSSRGSSAFAR